MPFYEYQCEACGHRLEALQKMSDDPLVYCPECNEAQLKKLISAAAFHLKGTGWYETDFKTKPGNEKSDSKDSSSTNKTSGASDDKSSANKTIDTKKVETKKADSATTSAA